MAERVPVEYPVSAGGVVYRVRDGVIEVVLGQRKGPRTWNLPKGTPVAGESMEEAALREVGEETGLEVELEASLGSITYWFVRPPEMVRCKKTVHFYLMRPVGGALSCHDPEFDDVQWYPGEEALRLLTHRNEVRIAEKALAQVIGP